MQKAVEIIPTLDFFEFILFLNKISPKLKISTCAFNRALVCALSKISNAPCPSVGKPLPTFGTSGKSCKSKIHCIWQYNSA